MFNIMNSYNAFTSARSHLVAKLFKINSIDKTQQRILSHFQILFIATRGIINFLHLLRDGDMDVHSYRYHFGKNFDWIKFNRFYVSDQCSVEKIIGFDQSKICRSNKHTHGEGRCLFLWTGKYLVINCNQVLQRIVH